jgi:ABC-type proline/glycine betaine transport system ATPase subunit
VQGLNPSPIIENPWDHFKEHFTEAYNDYNFMQHNHHMQANAAVNYQYATSEASANLATTTCNDLGDVAQITDMNASLISQVAALASEISKLSMSKNNTNSQCNSSTWRSTSSFNPEIPKKTSDGPRKAAFSARTWGLLPKAKKSPSTRSMTYGGGG